MYNSSFLKHITKKYYSLKNLQHLDFYLLRIPSFSLQRVFLLNQIVNGKTLLYENRTLLKKIFSNDNFEKAILLASKPLYNHYKKWLNSVDYDVKSEQRLIKSLYKYYIRMSTRPTPFGLFAGFSFGNISDSESCIRLAENYMLPHYDFDMRVLVAIDEYVSKKSVLRDDRIFYTNNTIYRFIDKYRYISYNTYNYQKKHFLTEIDYSDFLEYILELANDGISFKSLISILRSNVEGADKNMFYKYIENLIDLNILTDEELDITNNIPPVSQLIKKIEKEDILLPSINDEKISIENIIRIEEKLKQDYNINTDQLLMVNLKINTKVNNLNKKVVEEISSSIEELMQLQIRTTPKNLLEFKKSFLEKYDSQEKSLNEVIDFDLGIGYGSQTSENIVQTSLLDDINYFQTKFDNKEIVDIQAFKFISKKLKDCMSHNRHEIEILNEDLIELKSKKWQINDNIESSYIMGTLLSNSFSDLDDGRFFFLSKNNLPTPHMGNLISRFAYRDEVFKNKIWKHINKFIEKNSNEQIVYAEIIYNPGGKISNVILRPNFYSYHIEYGGSTSVTNSISTKLSVDDLYVSIQNNRIVLRSKKLNKEIIPRLTSAHNFSIEGLPLFRFLCDLQFQKVNTGFTWDWGIFKFNDFLPRVIYKKIILTPAQWILEKKDFEKISLKFQEILKISRYCYIADGDNELVLDLENIFCQELIKEEVNNRDIILYEYIIEGKNSIIKNNLGDSYSSEIIIPFKNTERKNLDSLVEIDNKDNNFDLQRKYFPGDEWIYFKIYLTNGIADEILVKCLYNFLYDKIKNNEISSWFFIRYDDPKHHLRIRMKNLKTTIDKITKELNCVCDKYIKHNIIYDISINTYERELERYSNRQIVTSELLFYNDSIAIINIIEHIYETNADYLRHKIALINVNILLDDFKLSYKEKYEFINKLSLNFVNEFIDWNQKETTTHLLNKSLKVKFRDEKIFLNKAIFNNNFSEELIPFVKILKSRSKAHRKIIEQIDLPLEEKFDFIASHIHMSLNRLFNAKQRAHEMVVYYLLREIYNSILRRNDSKN